MACSPDPGYGAAKGMRESVGHAARPIATLDHPSGAGAALPYSINEADHLRHLMNADVMSEWGEESMLRGMPCARTFLVQQALLEEAIRCARDLRQNGYCDAELWFIRNSKDVNITYKRRFTLADIDPNFS